MLCCSTSAWRAAACTSGTVLSTGGTSFTHTALVGGTTYFYRVCVADNAGNVASGATVSYTAPVLDTTAPTGTLGIHSGAAATGSARGALNLGGPARGGGSGS